MITWSCDCFAEVPLTCFSQVQPYLDDVWASRPCALVKAWHVYNAKDFMLIITDLDNSLIGLAYLPLDTCLQANASGLRCWLLSDEKEISVNVLFCRVAK